MARTLHLPGQQNDQRRPAPDPWPSLRSRSGGTTDRLGPSRSTDRSGVAYIGAAGTAMT